MMRKMEQEEFEQIRFNTSPKECEHPEIVRIYTLGAHTDYGCLKCGLEHTNKDVFDKPGLTGYK